MSSSLKGKQEECITLAAAEISSIIKDLCIAGAAVTTACVVLKAGRESLKGS
jgi:hypothetical protein